LNDKPKFKSYRTNPQAFLITGACGGRYTTGCYDWHRRHDNLIVTAKGALIIKGDSAVVEKESVVRSRAYPVSARFCGASAVLRALILILAALTAACAPKLAAEGPEMRMPAIERSEGTGDATERYVTRDGLRLGLKHWDASAPFAAIVALHGMSDYSNAFAIPASWWAEHGITTYAYDQRGFGRSPQLGIWPGNDVMRRDLGDFVDVVKARHPGLPVYVLGESMGGAVAMTAFASNDPPKADGLILVSPAVWSQKTMPLSYRVALWATSRTFRWWPLSGSGLKIVPSGDNAKVHPDELYNNRFVERAMKAIK